MTTLGQLDDFKPTDQRIQELVDLYSGECTFRDPTEYYDWDDLIEVEEKLTYKEWNWCARNFNVEHSISITVDGYSSDAFDRG